MELLTQEGFSPKRFKNSTGLYVDVGKGNPKVGLRTDIDALWQEVDGHFRANHSCGHDGHMTMAIGTLLLLKNYSNLLMVQSALFSNLLKKKELERYLY